MKRVLLSIFASGLCAGALAVPAKPGITAYTQPDGTIVNIMIVGDEHGHVIYSEGGDLLVEKEGRLEYAAFDSEGCPVGSGIMYGANSDFNVRDLQTKTAIGKWAEMLSSNRQHRVERLQEARVMRKCLTRSEETVDPDGEVEEGRLVPKNFARCETDFPVLGKQKGIVILVEYQDIKFEYGDHEYFHRMLNEEGFHDNGSLGSARDWFIENSNGQFFPEFEVFGPVTLPYDRVYYGGNDRYGSDERAHEMAIHACQILDEEVDFSQYDADGDGIIDNVFIFYAGKGEHDSKIANAVWPHSWDVALGIPDEKFIFDEVQLNHYACSCEYRSGYNRPDGIGTFVHEFSHVMGLPDLYVTNYSTGFTPGDWSVMDKGPYNNSGLTPPNYSSYERGALGWIDFKPFTDGIMEIHDLSTVNEAYALPTDKENEFYFFENRQLLGNDKYLPGHGMLVWHVDFKKSFWALNQVNNSVTHHCVDLIEADNVKTEPTREADTFPGTKGITSFGFDTKPQLASWSKKRLEYDIEDITESEDGVISFKAVRYEENAVESIGAEVTSGGVYYDLTGRRVANPGKGIYIRDGKKVIF